MGELLQVKKTRLPRARDAFYQAIPVNEIMGQFFYFGRTKMTDVELFKREQAKKLALLEALPEDRKFVIVFDAAYGVPSALAYRIWTGIEKYISDAGSDVDRRLILSRRQLSAMAKRSGYGGKTGPELAIAIKQIENAEIVYWHNHVEDKNEDGTPHIVTEHFSLFEKSTNVREALDVAPHLFIITVPDIVVNLIFHDRNFFCMSWDRIDGLKPQESSAARLLYRYMSYSYSNSKSKGFVYTKDYATMCKEWFGGLKPFTTESEAARGHLNGRFVALVECGMLKEWEVVKNRSETGLNVRFTPGDGFFSDYNKFYKGQIPLDFGAYKSKHDAHAGRPHVDTQDASFALVEYFHKQWFGKDAKREFLTSEIDFALVILKKHSFDESKKFVAWAIERARETKFKMQVFGGLKQYLPQWEDGVKTTTKKAHESQDLNAKRDAMIQENLYADFRAFEAKKTISKMDEKTHALLTKNALAELQAKQPEIKSFPSGQIIAVERRLIADNLDLPDFKTWRKNQEEPAAS